MPHLPFVDGQFDIALCSHFLFLYSEQLSEQFHLDSLVDLARVAREVRVFPLTELSAAPSRHLATVSATLEDLSYHIRIERVDYEFQRGANEMMRITRNQ